MRTRTQIAALATIVAAILLLGPRVPTDTPPQTPANLPADLDAYLADEEATAEPITPNTEKTIVWHDAPNQPTDIAVDSDDPSQHVLAGDILSPRTKDEVVGRSAEFLRRELP